MKQTREFLRALALLTLALYFSAGRHAQAPEDLSENLSISISIRKEGANPTAVFGTVTNKTDNAYLCARLGFDLFAHTQPGPPPQPGRHLGVLFVDVMDLRPRGERTYDKALPSQAGLATLKSVTACPRGGGLDRPQIISLTAEPARLDPGQTTTIRWLTDNADSVFFGEQNPAWSADSSAPAILSPRALEPSGSLQASPAKPVKYVLEAKKGGISVRKIVDVEVVIPCTISGIVRGRLEWVGSDLSGVPGGTVRLTYVQLRSPELPERMTAKLAGRRYTFTNVPPGRTYTVSPALGFRSNPPERSVRCEPGKNHRVGDITIIDGPREG